MLFSYNIILFFIEICVYEIISYMNMCLYFVDIFKVIVIGYNLNK